MTDMAREYLPKLVGRNPAMKGSPLARAVLTGKYIKRGLLRAVKHRDHTVSYVLTDAGKFFLAGKDGAK